MDSTTDGSRDGPRIISWIDLCEKLASDPIAGQGDVAGQVADDTCTKLSPATPMSSPTADGDGDAGSASQQTQTPGHDEDRADHWSESYFSGSDAGTEAESRASPIKRFVELKFLHKPIDFTELSLEHPYFQLPRDVHDLYWLINRLTEMRVGFIPAATRGIVEEKALEWPDHWFGRGGGQDAEPKGGKEAARLLAQRQFRALRSITEAAKQSAKERRGGLAWSNMVHSRLLRRAASFPDRGVGCEAVMDAGIASQWLPETSHWLPEKPISELGGGKLVDFALVVDLRPSDRAYGDAIVNGLSLEPAGTRSINQTMYDPLTLKPIGVSVCVENRAKDDDDGSVRLAVWTAAWHRRISELLPKVTYREGIMTLPLLVCNGHAWSLYFACDRGAKIEMVGPVSLGGTHSLSSTYALFAALQELCRWVGGPFREWLGTVLREESTGPW